MHTTRELTSTHLGIATTNGGFMAAMNRGDVAGAVRDTYTTDARVLPPGVPMLTGRDAITAYWQGVVRQVGLQTLELTSMDLQPMGDGVYEVGRAVITTSAGQRLTSQYVVLWKQESGRWRWHVDIWNAVA
jgi:ketosteroid isomerase-like protein